MIGEWNGFFPSTPPIGWCLRTEHSDIWLRIYSLPEGKRYPESQAEMESILCRHDIVAKSVLGVDQRLLVFWYWKSDVPGLGGIKILDYIEDEETTFDIFGTEVNGWNLEEFSPLLMEVANDEISSVVFYNPVSGNVYAPYDGGADLLIQSDVARSLFSDKYAAWVSPGASGL